MPSKPVKNTKKSKGKFDGKYTFGFDIDISKMVVWEKDPETNREYPMPIFDTLAHYFCVAHSDTMVREEFSCPTNLPEGQDATEFIRNTMLKKGRKGKPCICHFEFNVYHDSTNWVVPWIREQIEREPDWLISKLSVNKDVPISKADEELKRAVLEFCRNNKDALVRDGWYADLGWHYWYNGVKLMKPMKEVEDSLLSQAYEQSGGFSDYNPDHVTRDILENELIYRNLQDHLFGKSKGVR